MLHSKRPRGAKQCRHLLHTRTETLFFFLREDFLTIKGTLFLSTYDGVIDAAPQRYQWTIEGTRPTCLKEAATLTPENNV